MSYISDGGSSRLRITVPRMECGWDRGQTLFERFHRFPPDLVVIERCQRTIPATVVKVGHLRGVIYSSDRGNKGRTKTYIHFMKTPPLLACDPEGTRMFVLGGDYRITPRGIEG